MFKKGDRVLVWSLQSFNGGGFLNGAPAFVKQGSTGSEESVILCVIRNFNGVYKIDESYEVYSKQVELVGKEHWSARKDLRKLRKKIMADPSIS